MSGNDTSGMIRELAQGLKPVRPIPSLRQAALGVGMLWLVAAGVALLIRGLRPDLLGQLEVGSAFSAILAGLMMVAVGGVLAGLAGFVPGREAAGRFGLVLGAIGVVLAAGMGGLLVVRELAGAHVACPFENDLACFAIACLIALPPALGVLVFAARGAPYRPLVAVLAGATGTVALGAMCVQLSCPEVSARHVILSHSLAPFLGALLLTPVFHFALQRLTRE